MTEQERLLTKAEARELLGGISASTLDRLIREGDIKTVHVGRRVFIPASEIDKFIRDNMK